MGMRPRAQNDGRRLFGLYKRGGELDAWHINPELYHRGPVDPHIRKDFNVAYQARVMAGRIPIPRKHKTIHLVNAN